MIKKLFFLLLTILFFPIFISAQCVPVNGCINGKGTYTWESGNKYEGEFKDGLFHGIGKFYYSNGDIYVGSWEKDKKKGQGVFTSFDGNSYDGEWLNNKEHGKGVFLTNDGDRYEGSWIDGFLNGYGNFNSIDSNQYSGNFKQNLFNGYGTFIWNDGDRYEGEWLDNKKYGQGVFYSKLNIKNGEWKDDRLFDGVSTIYSSKEGEEGLEIKFIYKKGNVVDTLQNNKNYFNKDDVIGDNISDTISLINRKTKYDIILKINNVPVTWRFDTGAETTSISIDQWEKIKSKINYEDLNIIRKTEGVGGFSSGRLVKIKDEILIGDYLVKNFIISIANNKHSLLGIDFLKKFSNVEWNMKEASLIIYR